MGEHVEQIILYATKAFIDQDERIAGHAIEFDSEIDNYEKQIESMCLKLLLRQQPVAKDLRVISSSLKIITDLEHIGDQSSEIANLTLRLMELPEIEDVNFISKMSDAVIFMVTNVINAFVNSDLELALKVIGHDDIVDDLFNGVKNKLIKIMQTNANNCEQAIDLLMIAKYFERIGDHATSIASWTIFSITGSHFYDEKKARK
jgi:phosphate transport system protein